MDRSTVSRLAGAVQRGRVDLAVVSLRHLDELALPPGPEGRGIWVENLGQLSSGEITVVLLASDNETLLAELRVALAHIREQGVIQQIEKRYFAGP